MKAAYIRDDSNPTDLTVGERPMPRPRPDQLLIRVNAAGVTPTETGWYPTTHTKAGTRRTGAIPGHEFSGVVVEVGNEVQGFSIGDEVYGMNDWFEQGATAEYCLAVPSGIALKPAGLAHIEAAVTPIGALTAWQGLFVHGKLKAGDRLLVHGGAGTVGAFAVQLAKLHSAYVIATCSQANVELLRSLNVDQIINHETTHFEDVVSEVDMVFDTVGGDSLERSWPLLRKDGRAVTIAADAEKTMDERIKAAFFIVEPSYQQLSDLGNLFDSQQLSVFVGSTFPIVDAPEAYRLDRNRGEIHGKSVVLLL